MGVWVGCCCFFGFLRLFWVGLLFWVCFGGFVCCNFGLLSCIFDSRVLSVRGLFWVVFCAVCFVGCAAGLLFVSEDGWRKPSCSCFDSDAAYFAAVHLPVYLFTPGIPASLTGGSIRIGTFLSSPCFLGSWVKFVVIPECFYGQSRR